MNGLIPKRVLLGAKDVSRTIAFESQEKEKILTHLILEIEDSQLTTKLIKQKAHLTLHQHKNQDIIIRLRWTDFRKALLQT